jgi:hypothetical protein
MAWSGNVLHSNIHSDSRIHVVAKLSAASLYVNPPGGSGHLQVHGWIRHWALDRYFATHGYINYSVNANFTSIQAIQYICRCPTTRGGHCTRWFLISTYVRSTGMTSGFSLLSTSSVADGWKELDSQGLVSWRPFRLIVIWIEKDGCKV